MKKYHKNAKVANFLEKNTSFLNGIFMLKNALNIPLDKKMRQPAAQQ